MAALRAAARGFAGASFSEMMRWFLIGIAGEFFGIAVACTPVQSLGPRNPQRPRVAAAGTCSFTNAVMPSTDSGEPCWICQAAQNCSMDGYGWCVDHESMCQDDACVSPRHSEERQQ